MENDKPANLKYPVAYVYRPPEGEENHQVALNQEAQHTLCSKTGIDSLIEACLERKLDPDTITFVTKEQVKLLNLCGEDNVYPFSDKEKIELLKKLREALVQSA